MTDIIFKDNHIQVGERIKIPKPIIDTLNLHVGDKIIIKFDAEKKIMQIVEEKNEKKK